MYGKGWSLIEPIVAVGLDKNCPSYRGQLHRLISAQITSELGGVGRYFTVSPGDGTGWVGSEEGGGEGKAKIQHFQIAP